MAAIKVITVCRNFQIVIDNSKTKSNTHSASRTDLQGSKLNCYTAGNFFSTARGLDWLLRGHMPFNNETVFRQHL